MEKKNIILNGVLLLNISIMPFASIFAKGKQRPNVVFILADDIGYGDLGCYGAKKIKTPNLDALAENGVRFTNAYSPASTSSPTRYAFLTGEYAWRKNVGIMPGDAPLSIDVTANTLPKEMKAADYVTAIVGKWHLGLGKKGEKVDFNKKIDYGMKAVGFDYSFIFPATNDRVPTIFMENDMTVGLDSNDPISVSYTHKIGNDPTGKENPDLLKIKYLSWHNGTIINGISRIGWMTGGNSARWTDETMGKVMLGKAKEFIKSNSNKPFFLYYATHNAHEPRVPSPLFKGKSQAGIYGDVIEEFDYYVGEVVQTLKDNGLYDNTIIIITSDNAPMIKEGYDDGALENINGHDPFPNLRGMKSSLYEGGNKVPFICSWPNRIKKPFVQQQRFCFMDMLATLPHLVKSNNKQKDYNDSKDASKLFLKENTKFYRDYIITQNNGGKIAIHKENWKYIQPIGKRQAELYDLNIDPREKRNLINSDEFKVQKTEFERELNKLN